MAQVQVQTVPLTQASTELRQALDSALWCVLEEGVHGGGMDAPPSVAVDVGAVRERCDRVLAALRALPGGHVDAALLATPAARLLRLHPTATVLRSSGRDFWLRHVVPALPALQLLAWTRLVLPLLLEVAVVGGAALRVELVELAGAAVNTQCADGLWTVCAALAAQQGALSPLAVAFMRGVGAVVLDSASARVGALRAVLETAHLTVTDASSSATVSSNGARAATDASSARPAKRAKGAPNDQQRLQASWDAVDHEIATALAACHQLAFIVDWPCVLPAPQLHLHAAALAQLLAVALAHAPAYASCPSARAVLAFVLRVLPRAHARFQPAFLDASFAHAARLLARAAALQGALRAEALRALAALEPLIHVRCRGIRVVAPPVEVPSLVDDGRAAVAEEPVTAVPTELSGPDALSQQSSQARPNMCNAHNAHDAYSGHNAHGAHNAHGTHNAHGAHNAHGTQNAPTAYTAHSTHNAPIAPIVPIAVGPVAPLAPGTKLNSPCPMLPSSAPPAHHRMPAGSSQPRTHASDEDPLPEINVDFGPDEGPHP